MVTQMLSSYYGNSIVYLVSMVIISITMITVYPVTMDTEVLI